MIVNELKLQYNITDCHLGMKARSKLQHNSGKEQLMSVGENDVSLPPHIACVLDRAREIRRLKKFNIKGHQLYMVIYILHNIYIREILLIISFITDVFFGYG